MSRQSEAVVEAAVAALLTLVAVVMVVLLLPITFLVRTIVATRDGRLFAVSVAAAFAILIAILTKSTLWIGLAVFLTAIALILAAYGGHRLQQPFEPPPDSLPFGGRRR